AMTCTSVAECVCGFTVPATVVGAVAGAAVVVGPPDAVEDGLLEPQPAPNSASIPTPAAIFHVPTRDVMQLPPGTWPPAMVRRTSGNANARPVPTLLRPVSGPRFIGPVRPSPP